MKKIYLYIAVIFFTIIGLFSCNWDYDSFADPTSYTTNPSDVNSITAKSLPGQIVLKWNVPADSNYYFLRVSYYDHLTKKNKSELATVYRDSIIIDETRAKYGDYEFKFQTFNSKNIGGETSYIKARSGAAPKIETVTVSKIKLTADQLSTNAQEQTEGPIANLLDGNSNTFFHTDWHGQVAPPHYFDIHLKEPLTNIQIYFQNRNGSQACAKIVNLLISNNGINWELFTTINTGLPSDSKAEYTSQIFRGDKSFTYLRWYVVETYGNTAYWNMAEFALYDATITIYDPEAPDAD